MHADTLTRMANQIGQFFEAMPDRDEALESAARHIKSYWEPRMRRDFLAAIDAPGGVPELSAFMAESVGRYRVDIEVGGPHRLPLPTEEKHGGDAG